MKQQKGQSMIEFIVILPVFLFIFVVLISICEFTLSYMWADYQLYRAALCLDHSSKTTCLIRFNTMTNSLFFSMIAISIPSDFNVTENEIRVKTKLYFKPGFFEIFENLDFLGFFQTIDLLKPYTIEKSYFYPIMRNI